MSATVSPRQGLMCKGLPAPPDTGRGIKKDFIKCVPWLGLSPTEQFLPEFLKQLEPVLGGPRLLAGETRQEYLKICVGSISSSSGHT